MGRPPFLPGWVLAAAALILLGALFAQPPIVGVLTGEPVAGVRIFLSPAYLALAPFSAVLDQLSLLTDRQHVWMLAGLFVTYVAWRVVRRSSGGARSRLRREPVWFAGALALLLAVYAFGVLGTRPMAALATDDPDIVIIDFHSHTEASHDGRPGLDVDARRTWHEGAGFHLVYVTDHVGIDAALEAQAGNPTTAGDGLSMLVGREVRYRDQHVVVLGPIDPLTVESPDEPWPVLIQTLPNNLSRVPVPYAPHDTYGGVHAIELVDADPRGLRQSVEERDRILAIADSLDLALVAGSNHHGWGRAAAAWNLMRIPGWQTWTPTELAAEVEERVRRERAASTVVVERPRLAGGTRDAGLLTEAATLPRMAWHTLVVLTPAERVAWLLWLAAASVTMALAPGALKRATVTEPAPEVEPERSFY